MLPERLDFLTFLAVRCKHMKYEKKHSLLLPPRVEQDFDCSNEVSNSLKHAYQCYHLIVYIYSMVFNRNALLVHGNVLESLVYF